MTEWGNAKTRKASWFPGCMRPRQGFVQKRFLLLNTPSRSTSGSEVLRRRRTDDTSCHNLHDSPQALKVYIPRLPATSSWILEDFAPAAFYDVFQIRHRQIASQGLNFWCLWHCGCVFPKYLILTLRSHKMNYCIRSWEVMVLIFKVLSGLCVSILYTSEMN